MNSFAKGVFTMFIVMVGMLTIAQFDAIDNGYGYGFHVGNRAVPSPYDDGLECQQFTYTGGIKKFLCYEQFQASVLGFEYPKERLAYSIDDGRHTPY